MCDGKIQTPSGFPLIIVGFVTLAVKLRTNILYVIRGVSCLQLTCNPDLSCGRGTLTILDYSSEGI